MEELSKKEFVLALVEGFIKIGIISFFFYRTWVTCVVFLPYLFLQVKKKKVRKKEEYRDKLLRQFQDGILAISSALYSGYSIENSFFEARKDLSLLYDKKEPIMIEFSKIIRGLEANERIEKLLEEFAGKSGLEDVESFAAVFSTARQWGGDMSLIIRATADRISGKIEVMREIKTILSSKTFELKIMQILPLLIMLYVELTTPGFFAPMYGNLTGIVVMTGCLAVYIFSGFLGDRIMKIQV